MNKPKKVETLTIMNLKGTEGFKTLLGVIDVIPDPSIKNGYKETKGSRIFISPTNYKLIRDQKAEGVMLALGLLKPSS